MEDFAVTCPLVPDAARLSSGSCSSPRRFGFGFLQTPPRGDALAVSLAFGSAKTWPQDLHLRSYVPCSAHTPALSRTPRRSRRRVDCSAWLGGPLRSNGSGLPALARPRRLSCPGRVEHFKIGAALAEVFLPPKGIAIFAKPDDFAAARTLGRFVSGWVR
jgi:hypothetical protein